MVLNHVSVPYKCAECVVKLNSSLLPIIHLMSDLLLLNDTTIERALVFIIRLSKKSLSSFYVGEDFNFQSWKKK